MKVSAFTFLRNAVLNGSPVRGEYQVGPADL